MVQNQSIPMITLFPILGIPRSFKQITPKIEIERDREISYNVVLPSPCVRHYNASLVFPPSVRLRVILTREVVSDEKVVDRGVVLWVYDWHTDLDHHDQ